MNHNGLTMKEVDELQIKFGKNEISTKKKDQWIKKIKHIFSEPIYILLSCSAIIYFVLGEAADGAIMMAFVIFVIGIDVLQDIRTGNTLRKLKEISTPKVQVIREGKKHWVPGAEIVPGDVMLISEGVKIPADGYLISATGLCVDESILTGESQGVWKSCSDPTVRTDDDHISVRLLKRKEKEEYFRKDYCYTGTHVILGTGTVLVEKIGNYTEYGKIAERIAEAPMENSVLQKQMKALAKQFTYIAVALFILVGSATFFNLSDYVMSERIIHSGLAGVVLALSMVPGEFPVILSVFFTMGALRLARKKALIRHLPVVETLGAVSVLCMDKTGTITQNLMQVTDYWIADHREGSFCKVMALSGKSGTFDPVENALLTFREKLCSCCDSSQEGISVCSIPAGVPKLLHEYAFTNELKAMGQVWQEGDQRIIAAKGSPETILSLCYVPMDVEKEAHKKIAEYSKNGLRVIALADRSLMMEEPIPGSLLECNLFFRGVIGLSDPPREGMKEQIRACYMAGIRIVMITGDHPITASAIAEAVGIHNPGKVIIGDEIMKLTEEELRRKVMECNLFARVLPLHKMRIVKALKDNGEIVAMTGDGVNDSPAQKIADIGIAMGKHGSDVCREAADLILLDDNFTTILESISDGRRIYQNMKRAIAYVLAFHVPIALISLIAPILRIAPEALMLLPLHIVLLELVMDPTCSVALERQPAEDNVMKKPPRKANEPLLNQSRLIKSIIQGIAIFSASFGSYYMALMEGALAAEARTIGFAVLVTANIFLVSVNCSDTEAVFHILRKMRKDKGIWFVNLGILTGLAIMIFSPLHSVLGFEPLILTEIIKVIGVAAISVLWYEIVKLAKFLRRRLNSY